MVRRRRRIGPLGTVARLAIGSALVWVAVATGSNVGDWILGAAVMPGAVLLWHRIRIQVDPEPIRLLGPLAHNLTVGAFLVLVLTPYYAPPLSVLSGAGLIFFGGSMIVAGLRGYRGCEVLAVSNWILKRNDQMGCVLYSPLDRLESRIRDAGIS